MGIDYTAYAAYGFELPSDQHADDVDERLNGAFRPVGYLSAGSFGRDRLFLVTECVQTDQPGNAEPIPTEVHPSWDALLREAAAHLGVPASEIPAPGWLLVTDIG